MKQLLCALTLAASLGLPGPALAGVMTFDDPGVVEIDNDTGVATYTEGGFKLSGQAASFLTISNVLLGFADAPLSFKSRLGSPFTLLSLDYGFFDLGAGETPGALTVMGLVSGVTVVSQVLPLGALAHFNFGSLWANLSEVTFTATSAFVLDNISTVPAPGSLALAMLAMAVMSGLPRLGAATRRRAM